MNQVNSSPKPPVQTTGASFKNVCLWLLVVFLIGVVAKAITWASLNSMDATGKIDWGNLFAPR